MVEFLNRHSFDKYVGDKEIKRSIRKVKRLTSSRKFSTLTHAPTLDETKDLRAPEGGVGHAVRSQRHRAASLDGP